MSVIRVKVNPEVIRDAVMKSDRSLEEVKNQFKTFDRWMKAELSPTFNQVTDLSRFLRVPFGYLLLETRVEEEIPLLEFRTVDTDAVQEPSRELIDTIYDMERKQAWLRDAYLAENREKLNFVGYLDQTKDTNHLEVAEQIRSILSLNKDWFTKANSRVPTFNLLREHLSVNGIFIMQNGTALNNTHRPLDIHEFRAFTLIDEYVPLIFINSVDSVSGKTFSLLHELVHVFYGRHSLYNNDYHVRNKYTSPIEVICNRVAGELIAPTSMFITYWKKDYHHISEVDEKISLIADDFKVSKLIVARKALDNKYINQSKYNETAALVRKEFELSRRARDGNTGGDPVNNALSRIDHNFFKMLVYAMKAGDIQYTDAYRLAGVGRGVFEDMMERVEGVT